MRTYLLVKCALVGFIGGLLVLNDGRLGTQWHGVGLLLMGCLCVALLNLNIWPEAFSRRRAPEEEGPAFEVGDPHAPAGPAAPTPLIQAMHRVRGKRRKSPD